MNATMINATARGLALSLPLEAGTNDVAAPELDGAELEFAGAPLPLAGVPAIAGDDELGAALTPGRAVAPPWDADELGWAPLLLAPLGAEDATGAEDADGWNAVPVDEAPPGCTASDVDAGWANTTRSVGLVGRIATARSPVDGNLERLKANELPLDEAWAVTFVLQL